MSKNLRSLSARCFDGVTQLPTKVSDEVRPEVLFTSFHFPNVAINRLTSDMFDADSMTPEYKVTAVDVHRNRTNWSKEWHNVHRRLSCVWESLLVCSALSSSTDCTRVESTAQHAF
jgi:predicted molibdopterin-dependent oxidoreductase YjgC